MNTYQYPPFFHLIALSAMNGEQKRIRVLQTMWIKMVTQEVTLNCNVIIAHHTLPGIWPDNNPHIIRAKV